jgi:hypothetical protein
MKFFQTMHPPLNTLVIPGHVDDDYELPYLYWIPKLHIRPYYKQKYIDDSKKNVLQNLCQYSLQKY